MKINVRIDGINALRATIDGMGRQIPFAASVAINRTAAAAGNAERGHIVGGAFDRPKPQTVKSTYIRRSDKHDLNAEIGIKSRDKGLPADDNGLPADDKGLPADEYLLANIKGGTREYKRSELMLRRAGILPDNMFTVPGPGADLDAYGNMSRGQIVSILSFFRTFGNTSLNSGRMNITERTKKRRIKAKTDYFIVPVGSQKTHLSPGIWAHAGVGKIKPLLMFVRAPQYKAVYPFTAIALKVVREKWDEEFDRALKYAIATAR